MSAYARPGYFPGREPWRNRASRCSPRGYGRHDGYQVFFFANANTLPRTLLRTVFAVRGRYRDRYGYRDPLALSNPIPIPTPTTPTPTHKSTTDSVPIYTQFPDTRRTVHRLGGTARRKPTPRTTIRGKRYDMSWQALAISVVQSFMYSSWATSWFVGHKPRL